MKNITIAKFQAVILEKTLRGDSYSYFVTVCVTRKELSQKVNVIDEEVIFVVI